MKKAVFAVILLISCCVIFSGCIKNTPYITTIDPSMTASIGTYNFIASSVAPSTLDTQARDTATVLYITGKTSDVTVPYDKIVLSIPDYKALTGTYSIAHKEASATYYHSGLISSAIGGIVSITRITSNSIIGYFSFSTADGINVTNGTFNVGKP
jgi:hypothetical protein